MGKKSGDKETNYHFPENGNAVSPNQENSISSPLDIDGIDTDISTSEIVTIIRESRENAEHI